MWGAVVGNTGSLCELEGHAMMFDAGLREWVRQEGVRRRIFSLAEAGHVVTRLPRDAEVDDMYYDRVDGELLSTDGARAHGGRGGGRTRADPRRHAADRPVQRTTAAIGAGAELFVSIHTNALPDGVQPVGREGTSTYHYHPHSHDLDVAVQEGILATMGPRDLGVYWGDLAVRRMSWMPSVLAESSSWTSARPVHRCLPSQCCRWRPAGRAASPKIAG